MRIVRFHLEPWQRGNSVTPSPAQSPSLALLSPHVLRRQRPASLEDLEDLCSSSPTTQQQQQQLLRRQRRLKCRYPQVVKRLATLCSDVMARHVSSKPIHINTISIYVSVDPKDVLIEFLNFHFLFLFS